MKYDTISKSDLQFLLEIFRALEAGEFYHAEQHSKELLDMDPENAYAHLAKLMSERKVRAEHELSYQQTPLEESRNYKWILRFADDKLRQRIETCNQCTINKKHGEPFDIPAFSSNEINSDFLLTIQETQVDAKATLVDRTTKKKNKVRILLLAVFVIFMAVLLFSLFNNSKNKAGDITSYIQSTSPPIETSDLNESVKENESFAPTDYKSEKPVATTEPTQQLTSDSSEFIEDEVIKQIEVTHYEMPKSYLYKRIGLVFKNNSAFNLCVRAKVIFRDASGAPIDVDDTAIIIAFGPENEQIFVANTDSEFATYDVELSVNKDRYNKPISEYISYETVFQKEKVIVSVKSVAEKPIELIGVDMLFMKDGKVVDYGYNYGGDLKPGKTEYLQVNSKESFDSIMVFLHGFLK